MKTVQFLKKSRTLGSFFISVIRFKTKPTESQQYIQFSDSYKKKYIANFERFTQNNCLEL